MNSMLKKLSAFLSSETGAETVEWVVIAAVIIAIAVLVYGSDLQNAVQACIDKIADAINSFNF